MRICSPQLGISNRSILGGEIYDRQILKNLALMGVKTEIILPFLKPYENVKNWNITYAWLPFVYPPHVYNMLILPYLFSLYNKRPFDILRVHSPTFIGVAAAIFKKKYPSVPIVGIYHWLGEGGFVGKILDPYLLQFFDAVICDSLATKKLIEETYTIPSGKVFAIHNGIDERLGPEKKSIPLMKAFSFSNKTKILLYMGLFIQRKNPLFLIELMPKIINMNHNTVLLLCGNGPQEALLKKRISTLGMDANIKIVPPVYGKEKKDLFSIADIFVHPALNEGFSLAVIEAMGCGLPVVITRGFSAAEAVSHKKNGLLCTTKSEWIESIIHLLKFPTTRRMMSQNNVQKVRREFTWKIAAKKHLQLFQSLVSDQKQ